MMKNFAITGVAGFVAPRHLRAIRDTGHRTVAALDPHDAVGVLDTYAPDASFFTEFERFDRHLEKLRLGPVSDRIDYLTVCSPNYLHDAHVRLALRIGADAICEKPLVINPWNLDALQELQAASGRRVYTVLQLRLQPSVIALRERLLAASASTRHQVEITYVTPRGPWYQVSWKGSSERSGGLVTNIGIHFFDLLIWLFGAPRQARVHLRDAVRAAGTLDLERADVRWYLSIDAADLARAGGGPGRSLTIDGEPIDLTGSFVDLHTRVYEEVLAGRGFGIDDARPSIELVHRVRTLELSGARDGVHPLATRL